MAVRKRLVVYLVFRILFGSVHCTVMKTTAIQAEVPSTLFKQPQYESQVTTATYPEDHVISKETSKNHGENGFNNGTIYGLLSTPLSSTARQPVPATPNTTDFFSNLTTAWPFALVTPNTSDFHRDFNQTGNGGTSDGKDTKKPAVTREQFFAGRKIIQCFVNPVISVVGFVCNCLAVRILHEMFSAGNHNAHLLCLAVVDALHNLVGLFLSVGSIFEHLQYSNVQKIYAQAFPYTWVLLYSSLGRLSAALTVLLTFQRFLAVCFPFYVKRSCLNRRPSISIVVFSLLIPSYFLVSTFYYQADVITDAASGLSITMVKATTFGLKNRQFYQKWFNVGLVAFGALPVCLVAAVNVVIIIALCYNRRRHARMTSSNRRQKPKDKVAPFLTIVSLTYLVTHIPAVGAFFLTIVNNEYSSTGAFRYTYLLVIELTYMLGNLNSAANFALLIIPSGTRELIKDKCCKKVRDDP